jgi:glycosyltransferase involved in cell wall biosynthesis
VVFTVKNPPVPVNDTSLLREIPENVPVYYTRTLEPGYSLQKKAEDRRKGAGSKAARLVKKLLFPDRHVLWLPSALPRALSVARKWKVEAVLATMPPFSLCFLAAAVAGILKVPLILDFRDEWSGFYVRGYGPPNDTGPVWRGLVRLSEKWAVKRASAVVSASPLYKQRFLRLYGRYEDKYHWIPNGFDPADLKRAKENVSQKAREKIVFAYMGTLMGATSLAPFWRALEKLPSQTASRIKVMILGRVLEEELSHIDNHRFDVEIHGYLNHDEAIGEVSRNADVLLLTLADYPGANRVIPAKTYEYMALGKPVLLIAPSGVCGRIVRRKKMGIRISPHETDRLVKLLIQWTHRLPEREPVSIQEYERSFLAGRFSDILARATACFQKKQDPFLSRTG